ncbi:hypothetical protein [Alkaliphilus hydrothermalis]|uniref:Uncharacterized protein n=1 Tax=Alkaliphilus hydrothermalis TaxID=1482730 RepID=A0ABS2NLF5_9FIRM|nr:hypothetical protein [Alkaliphilus hydrothermalis]MBM7613775.1 hypothetical protein [Alkaliphilus hydrothermalis]
MSIKRRYIGFGIFAILNVLWNFMIVAEGNGFDLVIMLNIIGDITLAFALMTIFNGFKKVKPVTNENPQMIALGISGISRLWVLYLKEGSLLRTTAFIQGAVVLISLLTLTGVIKSKSAKEMTPDEVVKFGYWWVAGVLLIPAVIILTVLGF